jgi:hypothetical protein
MTRPQLIVTSGSGLDYYEAQTATVWIGHTSTWSRPLDPIFHRIAASERLESTAQPDAPLERRGWRVATDCGALVHLSTWLQTPGEHDSIDYRDQAHGLSLPIRWALRFARPCRRCWP